MNNSVLNTVLYHDFLYCLNNHQGTDMLNNIKEYVCGNTLKQASDLNCLEMNVGEIKTHLSESGISDFKVETYVGEQGNICFFNKLLVEGVTYLAIPLNLGENVTMFACTDRLDMGTQSNIVLVGAEAMPDHLRNLAEECENIEEIRAIQDILTKIPRDTLLKLIDPDKYNDALKSTFKDDFDGLPETSYKSGFGMYLAGKEDGGVSGLFFDTLSPELVGRDVLDDSEGMPLVCCSTENYREFIIFEDDEIANSDTIEEYYIVNPLGFGRQVDSIIVEANVARDIRKRTVDEANPDKIARGASIALDSDRGARRAAAVPETFYKKVKEMNSGLRGFIANWRRSHDDNLREKLYNDEYIPLIDDIFELLISGASGYGVVAVGLVGPLAGAVIGLGVFIFANWRQKVDRKRILELLDDKINLLNEEIEDAKLDSDLVTKRQLIQIKKQLERKRAKISIGSSLSAR